MFCMIAAESFEQSRSRTKFRTTFSVKNVSNLGRCLVGQMHIHMQGCCAKRWPEIRGERR